MNVSLPRGTRDYDPGETIILKKIMDVAEDTFRRFGFTPIETPSIELLETLNAKAYGDEAKKELYILEGKTEGLRYDFTVPLARFMAMNKDIPLPFKRYQIGRNWRMDEPQRMRSREIIQADIDVVGSNEPISEAESIAAISSVLESIGIKEYSVLLNSRVILNSILSVFEVPKEKHLDAIRAIDKLDKVGREEVLAQLKKIGTDPKNAEALLNFIEERGENEETLGKLGGNVPDAKEEIKRIEGILGLLQKYKIKGRIVIDLSLARGLDYYTGTVVEFVVFEDGKKLPTIAAGGRYDDLMSMYSKKSVPAFGLSIGINRVFDIVGKGELLKTYAKVHIAYIKEENLDYAVDIANRLRAAGVYADLELTSRNLTKQLEYANSMNIKYVAIIGNQERSAKKIKLRDMVSGDEEVISVEEAIARLKMV